MCAGQRFWETISRYCGEDCNLNFLFLTDNKWVYIYKRDLYCRSTGINGQCQFVLGCWTNQNNKLICHPYYEPNTGVFFAKVQERHQCPKFDICHLRNRLFYHWCVCCALAQNCERWVATHRLRSCRIVNCIKLVTINAAADRCRLWINEFTCLQGRLMERMNWKIAVPMLVRWPWCWSEWIKLDVIIWLRRLLNVGVHLDW